MSKDQLDRELAAIEASLSNLTPAATTLQRDHLIFMAGKAMAEREAKRGRRRRVAWLWPCATAASFLLAAVFGSLWLATDRPVYLSPDVCLVAFDVDNINASSPSRWSNRRLCKTMLTQGADALPQPRTGATSNAPKDYNARALLRNMLDKLPAD